MKKTLTAFFASALLVAIDQLIKLWAYTTLRPNGDITLIQKVLSLVYHENFGAAFGILQNKQAFLVPVTSVIIIGAFYLIYKDLIKSRLELVAVTLIVGGGIGNLLDRIFRGFVVDYVYFEPINFPIFNFADSCVVIGTAFMIWNILVLDERKQTKEAE